jgi:E3 ubiquitin-protein ligase HUWE1
VCAEEYNALYVAEPEFVSELVGLVQAEEAVPEEALRTLALRALAAQLHDRNRISSVITGVTAGGQSGLLSMLLHKSIASILQQADVPLAPSGSGVLPADVAAAAATATSGGASSSAAAASSAGSGASLGVAAAAAPPVGSVQYSVAFVDALLAVVAALVQVSSGYQALNDAGVVAALLPLMRDLHPDHLGLVCTNLRILEAYMDLSQSAATMFRDLGGLTEMVKRLAYEVGVLTPPGQPQSAEGTAEDGASKDVVMVAAEQSGGQQQQQEGQAAETAAAGSSAAAAAAAAAPVKQLSHNRKALLKYLLRIIALSSYSPTGNVAATRPQDEDAQLLFASLKVGCAWLALQQQQQAHCVCCDLLGSCNCA